MTQNDLRRANMYTTEKCHYKCICGQQLNLLAIKFKYSHIIYQSVPYSPPLARTPIFQLACW